jgi:membrane protein involved in colicin uptake
MDVITITKSGFVPQIYKLFPDGTWKVDEIDITAAEKETAEEAFTVAYSKAILEAEKAATKAKDDKGKKAVSYVLVSQTSNAKNGGHVFARTIGSFKLTENGRLGSKAAIEKAAEVFRALIKLGKADDTDFIAASASNPKANEFRVCFYTLLGETADACQTSTFDDALKKVDEWEKYMLSQIEKIWKQQQELEAAKKGATVSTTKATTTDEATKKAAAEAAAKTEAEKKAAAEKAKAEKKAAAEEAAAKAEAEKKAAAAKAKAEADKKAAEEAAAKAKAEADKKAAEKAAAEKAKAEADKKAAEEAAAGKAKSDKPASHHDPFDVFGNYAQMIAELGGTPPTF